MKKPELRGLYCITDPALAQQTSLKLEQMVEQAILGGARIIQYRDKQATASEQLETAGRLCQLCKQHGAVFLVNDDPRLAQAVDAHGVHLGQGDSQLAKARSLLGPDKIIGITCHAELELALLAEQQGADYVAFGRFFPSQSKPEAPPASSELLPEARENLTIPIAAIGGITPDNGSSLLEARADMLAVIHAVFGQPDIRRAAENFSRLFD